VVHALFHKSVGPNAFPQVSLIALCQVENLCVHTQTVFRMQNQLFVIDGDGNNQGAVHAGQEFDKSVVCLTGFEDSTWPVSFSSVSQGRPSAVTFMSIRQKGREPDAACIVKLDIHALELGARCMCGHTGSKDPCRVAVVERWNSENPGNQVVLERRAAGGYRRVAPSALDENENFDSAWPRDVPGTGTSNMIRQPNWQERDSQGENSLPVFLLTRSQSVLFHNPQLFHNPFLARQR